MSDAHGAGVPGEADDRPVVAIVEDQAAIAEMLVELLEINGFRPVLLGFPVAPAGVAASRASVLLLDVMLPDRSGWDVLDTLRKDETTRDLPVIVTSAVYGRPGLHAIPEGGPVRFAPKPFDIVELVEMIRALLT